MKFYPDLVILTKMNGRKQDFAFIDFELYADLEEIEVKGGSHPSQQDIASRFGRDKTDASRTLNEFLKELKKFK